MSELTPHDRPRPRRALWSILRAGCNTRPRPADHAARPAADRRPAWRRLVRLEPSGAPPDWRGQVNGFAFAPYQRGQSAEDGDWPTAEQIAADLRVVAPLTRRIRTYTVDGGFDRIPAIARQQGLDLRVTLGAWLDGRAERDAAELKRLAAAARARNVDS